MSETKLATERFGTQSDVIDDTEILNLLESYHREYINLPLSRARWFSHIANTENIFFENQVFFGFSSCNKQTHFIDTTYHHFIQHSSKFSDFLQYHSPIIIEDYYRLNLS